MLTEMDEASESPMKEAPMPILSYRCQECGKEFSKIFFNPKGEPRKCPICHGENLAELGPTFQADEKTVVRAFGVSCEGCGDDACVAAGST